MSQLSRCAGKSKGKAFGESKAERRLEPASRQLQDVEAGHGVRSYMPVNHNRNVLWNIEGVYNQVPLSKELDVGTAHMCLIASGVIW